MVYRLGSGKGEGRAGGWKRKVCMQTHTHTDIYTHNPLPLIYFRSVLMSSWPRPQLLSADDLAPVLMKKPGNSTEDTHTDTQHARVAWQRISLLAQTHAKGTCEHTNPADSVLTSADRC